MNEPIKKRINRLEKTHSSADEPVRIVVCWDDAVLNTDDENVIIVGWPDDEND